MPKWLYYNGFSYKNPVGIPHKFSAEAQQVFVETYNELKQKKTGDDEPIATLPLETHKTVGTYAASKCVKNTSFGEHSQISQ